MMDERDAKRQRVEFDTPSAEEIESFLANNNIDERAAKELRSQGPSVQRLVLMKGTDLSMVNNASGTVVGRIRDACREVQSGGVPQEVPLEVVNFIESNRIDQAAAALLRSSERAIQLSVLDKGLDLSLCSNPSSAVISRIRDAKREIRMAQNGTASVRGGMGMMCGGAMQPMMQPGGFMPAGRSMVQMPAAAVQVSRPLVGGSMTMFGAPSPAEIDNFIAINNLDERAAHEFRKEGPSIQRNVIDKGDFSMCSNPSAAIIGRIREARQMVQSGMTSVRAFCPQEVENFIINNSLDDRAGSELRHESRAIQMNVLDKGMDLSLCQNPNSVVIGRIRDARKEVHGGGGGGGSCGESSGGGLGGMRPGGNIRNDAEPDLETFLTANNIDGRAAEQLRGAEHAIQINVMKSGMDLSRCTNPSGTIINRIRAAQKEKENGTLGLDAASLPPGPIEVENFIAANRLDEQAIRALRLADNAVQLNVLDKGLDLSLCAHPSVVVLARIRDAKRESTRNSIYGSGNAGQLSLSGGFSQSSMQPAPAMQPMQPMQPPMQTMQSFQPLVQSSGFMQPGMNMPMQPLVQQQPMMDMQGQMMMQQHSMMQQQQPMMMMQQQPSVNFGNILQQQQQMMMMQQQQMMQPQAMSQQPMQFGFLQ